MTWNRPGFHLDSTWTPDSPGTDLESTWNLPGIHGRYLEPTWSPREWGGECKVLLVGHKLINNYLLRLQKTIRRNSPQFLHSPEPKIPHRTSLSIGTDNTLKKVTSTPIENHPTSHVLLLSFNGEIYLYEREILYRPDAKVFTERGTGLVLTDDIWNIPKNQTKEDLLLHIPFDKKERLAHLIDQRNQQLSAERSKTQSPRNAPNPQNHIQDPPLKNQLLQDLVKSKDRDPGKLNHPRNHKHHGDNNLLNQEKRPLYHKEHPLHQEIHLTIHLQWQPPQITLPNSPSLHQKPSLERKPEHVPGSPNARHTSCNPVFVQESLMNQQKFSFALSKCPERQTSGNTLNWKSTPKKEGHG
ncbi:hypothetical protein M378DRAFT_18095 [Amanita muscaria Koide BX008]|uniref:Uncharacterized protein n=1 Tax=Amanita muscaria (strain Koide BX008) TaxID=946122 RepID=A0A0C2W2E1_AMAMK|nr:hypothetical protein M378DRAFT_18095 [Amanita muscaria Koide BX008]